MKNLFDVQYSIFNGLNDYQGVEKFLVDLREVLVKHNIKSIRSDIMLMDENVLVVRGSEFIGKNQVELNQKNRKDNGTNIYYDEINKLNKEDFAILLNLLESQKERIIKAGIRTNRYKNLVKKIESKFMD